MSSVHHESATGRTLLGVWVCPFAPGGDREVVDAVGRCVCRCVRLSDNDVVAQALNLFVERALAATSPPESADAPA